MRNKILIMGVVMLLMFSLVACSDDALEKYKAEGKAAIGAYAQERKDDCSEENWTVVCDIVEKGKQAVDRAENKPAAGSRYGSKRGNR